jgi:hypothetical protein
MPARSMTDPERLAREQAAYWLDHAAGLASKSVNMPGLTARIMRMRARRALKMHGWFLAAAEKCRLCLW